MRQSLRLQSHQVGNEKEQPAALRGELSRLQCETADISHWLDGWPRVIRSLFVKPPRQRSEAFDLEDFTDSSGAQGTSALLERLADFIDRVILLPELNDEVSSRRFFRLGLGSAAWGAKKDWVGSPAEMMTQDMERSDRVTEGSCDLFGWPVFDEIGAKSLVLTLPGMAGLEEETADSNYVFWCAYNHTVTLLYTTSRDKDKIGPKGLRLAE